MAKGRHSQYGLSDIDSTPTKNIVIAISVLVIIIVAVIFGGKKVYSTFFENGKLIGNEKKNSEVVEEKKEEIEDKMPTNLYGYKVLGELSIESKKYSSYILDSGVDYTQKSEDASKNNSEKLTNSLKKGIVKLYGNKLNEKGNFTIVGHNEDKKFKVLNDLKLEDEITVKTDLKTEKKYIVSEITKIEPTDLKALISNNDYTELTLITCAEGSNQRLVVKAIEETDYSIMKALKDTGDASDLNLEEKAAEVADELE